MTTRSKRTPKLLSLLLSTCMALSMVPLSALAADGDITIDETNFPQEHFGTSQLKSFDTNKDGVLSLEERNAVTNITLYDIRSEEDWKFAAYFPNVTEFDVTGDFTAINPDIFPKLEKLHVKSDATELDFSSRPTLKSLRIFGGPLDRINLSGNQDLKKLRIEHLSADGGKLDTVDLSKCTALETAEFSFSRVNNVILSKNENLKEMLFSHTQLEALDLSQVPNLTSLTLNQTNIGNVDLSLVPHLTRLSLWNTNVTELDLSHTPDLESLALNSTKLTSLDLSHTPKLKKFESNFNGITINQKDGFDYTTLPGSFDVSKVSNVVGGKFDADTHTFSFDADANKATYEYNTGYTGTAQLAPVKFTLTYEAPEVPEVPDPEPTEPEPTEPQPTEPTENPFTDVPTDRYFYEPVLWAVKNNITSGVSENEFGPYEACTRAQIATFLWASAGRPDPETTENPFTDVKESDYFYKAVLWAAENGITSGVSESEFGPYEVCTRAQAVTLLWAGEGKPVAESGTSFNDVAQGDYFYDAVQWAVKNNVTAGIGDGCFGPADNCQRGQIVTFMYKTFA